MLYPAELRVLSADGETRTLTFIRKPVPKTGVSTIPPHRQEEQVGFEPTRLSTNGFQDRVRYPESFGLLLHVGRYPIELIYEQPIRKYYTIRMRYI